MFKFLSKQLAIFVALTLLTVLFFTSDSVQEATFGWLNTQRRWIEDEYQQAPVLVSLIYALIYVATTALSIPVAVPLSLTAGVIFGFWLGTLIVITSATVGATISFLLARYLFRDLIAQRFGKELLKINAYIERDGPYYLFMIRLFPVFPFFLMNILLGLTTIKTSVYSGVSFIGMLAGTMMYVNAGVQLGRIQQVQDVFSAEFVIALALIGLAPFVIKKLIQKFYRGSDALKL